jgi:hypothetical protein
VQVDRPAVAVWSLLLLACSQPRSGIPAPTDGLGMGGGGGTGGGGRTGATDADPPSPADSGAGEAARDTPQAPDAPGVACASGGCTCTPGSRVCLALTLSRVCRPDGSGWMDQVDSRCKQVLGLPCASAGDCATGFCVRGLCCESSCAGKCQSCSGADTGAASGVCANIKAGTDPLGHCDASDPTTCGTDGECDGRGACRLFGPDTTCEPAGCRERTLIIAGRCDGQGACYSRREKDCGADQCQDGRCVTGATCNFGHPCPPDHDCVNGVCELIKGDGEPCLTMEVCRSNRCEDGVCCPAVCGDCQVCLPNGQCGFPRAIDTERGPCSGMVACNGRGGCARKRKVVCERHESCVTGYCAMNPNGVWTCEDCGGRGQPCCPSEKRCAAGTVCVASAAAGPGGGECQSCGQLGQRCCPQGGCLPAYRCGTDDVCAERQP